MGEDAAALATVDRIADGVALLLVEPDGREQRVPADALPEGAGEGTVLRVTLDPVKVLGVDEEATARRREDAERRLERLRRERGGRRFPRPGG